MKQHSSARGMEELGYLQRTVQGLGVDASLALQACRSWQNPRTEDEVEGATGEGAQPVSGQQPSQKDQKDDQLSAAETEYQGYRLHTEKGLF